VWVWNQTHLRRVLNAQSAHHNRGTQERVIDAEVSRKPPSTNDSAGDLAVRPTGDNEPRCASARPCSIRRVARRMGATSVGPLLTISVGESEQNGHNDLCLPRIGPPSVRGKPAAHARNCSRSSQHRCRDGSSPTGAITSDLQVPDQDGPPGARWRKARTRRDRHVRQSEG
jgi:hypothetical protein